MCAAWPIHTALETTVAGVSALVGRTGYTGEDGYELFFPADQAGLVWEKLMESGAPHGLLPVGFGRPRYPAFPNRVCRSTAKRFRRRWIHLSRFRLGGSVRQGAALFGREALLKVRLEGPTRKLGGL
jgi:aminomethyltransferase